jgi:hypothetical protein
MESKKKTPLESSNRREIGKLRLLALGYQIIRCWDIMNYSRNK